jgi:zinc protease
MKRLAASFVVLLLVTLPLRAEIDIAEITTPGGLKAWHVEETSIPFVALELRFRGGASLDAPGKRGAINLMTALLEEGAGDLDARGFAEAREALAASYRFSTGDDSLSISAQFLNENRDQAVALLRKALREPRFDEDAIERVRAQILAGLKRRETDPDTIAGAAFDELAYDDHPYGSYNGGTVESVTSLTRADILDAFTRAIARDRLYIAAVGDISAEELGALLDGLLGDLPKEGAPMPENVAFGATGGITVLPFDTPQSVARFGHAGVEVGTPEFFPAFILNTIMGGGGFNSRLMTEVREKRGLTYGIRTYLIDSEFSESLIGSVSTVNLRMAETIDVVRGEWERMAREGVTAEELETAKIYLTGAYPLRFDGNAPIARILVNMQMQGYPTSYVKTRNAMIEAVTLEDINRVAARLYRSDDLRFVIVGAPEGLESDE